MADRTGIEWTDASWNPVIGCSLVSPGCTNCYAMGQAARIVRCSEGLGRASTYDGTVATVKGRPIWTGKVALASEATLTQPLRWKRPRRIFVNSMGDLFHEDVPDEWIDRVFAVMALSPQHTFQILTKRSARMRAYMTERHPGGLAAYKVRVCAAVDEIVPMRTDASRAAKDAIVRGPLPNVWKGTSAEDQRRADERIPHLLATPSAIRFVSAEPLLGPIDFQSRALHVPDHDSGGHVPGLLNLDWIIVGGESGPNARPMHPDWARSIRDQCAAAGTAFFFKQWGEWAPYKTAAGGDLGGDVRRGFAQIVHASGRSPEEVTTSPPQPGERSRYMAKVGKARAGRLLDGVTHDAMPEVRHG